MIARRLLRACATCGAGPLALVSAVAWAAPHDYPPARRADTVDSYGGVQVADPYRWMEDIDSPETTAWVSAERDYTEKYLQALPGRAAIAARLKQLWNFERWTPPERHGPHWVWTHNDGLQNQSVLYIAASPDAAPRVLLDPNTLSADGTVALKGTAFSDDGKYMAYALSDGGSDWEIWRVRDLATGEDLLDELRWAKFGGAHWTKDGTGFFYTRYDAPPDGDVLKATNTFQKIYFHLVGAPQASDTLVYTRSDDPDWFVDGEVTDDGRYFVIQANHGDAVENTVLVKDLTRPDAPPQELVPEPKAAVDFVGNLGRKFFFKTDDGAPRERVVAIDLDAPAHEQWRTIVPEGGDTIQTVSLVGGSLLVLSMHDAHSAVRRFTPEGRLLGDVRLPGLGTAAGFGGRVEDPTTFYGYSSFTTPGSVYRLDVKSGRSKLWRTPKVAGFDSARYETRQVFYASKDGTRVPMFITARKGLVPDGSHPTLLYAYGGFNIPLTPTFSPGVAGWLDLGGVYVLANLRGGGEYGRDWHEAGMKTRKQNVFDDFAAAAQTLIDQKITSPRRLAIRGGSNGGLLVGATLEQHPELFGAAVAQVGVMDMLRFGDFTVGKGWESDYGSVENPEEFAALRAYSPFHNVQPGVDYPPTLITTGDHDDRVFPAHSFKFAAALQQADPDGHPLLIRIDSRAGHGQGKPTGKQIEETADIYAFVLDALGGPEGAAPKAP